MKRSTRIAGPLIALAALAIGSTRSQFTPDELDRHVAAAKASLARVAEGVEANPVPTLFALATFGVTVILRGRRAKPARESVVVLPAPASETAVLRRAKARATRTQLVADQILLENRKRALPEAIRQAERDASYTETALAEGERNLVAKEKAHAESVARLAALRREQATAQAEFAAIEAELRKLAGVI